MSVTANMIKSTANDKDLVELAGFHAYKVHDMDTSIYVNKTRYYIVDNIQDETGLNAMTVQNIKSGEFTIVYQGTQMKSEYGMQDMLTNVQLLSNYDPAQLQAARDYFEDMNEKYGVQSVCGNSLGGALANTVGVHYPEVKAVTLNPAILPEGQVKADQNYANVTNYFSKYDGLTRGEEALNLNDRFPGNIYRINNGIPHFSRAFGSNHTGYIGDSPDNQSINVGIEGQPGYGKIYIAADDHIVTSIWSGEPLYRSGSWERISINQESITALSDALKNGVIGRIGYVVEYINHATEIVIDVKARMPARLNELQRKFEDILENSFGNTSWFKGITTGGYVTKGIIDHLIHLLSQAETYCLYIEKTVKNRPDKLLEYMTIRTFHVGDQLREAQKILRNVKMEIDDLVNFADKFTREVIPRLLADEARGLADAVVDELYNHFQIVGQNKDQLLAQLVKFQKQVQAVGDQFQSADQSLAQGINQGSLQSGSVTIPTADHTQLKSSSDLPYGVNTKERHLNGSMTRLSASINRAITPLSTLLTGHLWALETITEATSATVKAASYGVWYSSPPAILIGLFTDWDDRLRLQVKQALKPLDEFANTIEGLRTGINHLKANVPALIQQYKPFIDQAIFDSNNYSYVALYNTAASDILDETALLFQDIVYQLSGQEAKSITALCETSRSVLKNIQLLHEDVSRAAIP
ncbi:hypothetical protein ABNN70_14870 [Sporolactobacillus sp. Y61]|uniref:DUF2974 domain-containing protein n=1 Tax=Sporolactobacillus sp. Y61 TaxID=3160863 RepID=A0AAU8IFD5_9BACL